MQSSPHLDSIECAMFRARARIVNLEAGLLALSLGGMAVGTDAPRTLAHLSMGIVMIFMVYRLRSFSRVHKLWREVFIGSQLAGERAAVVMSLLQSAKPA